jgi:hypothetical protein
MPDIKMPDGTIIRNVPEGTTRSQLMARYGKVKPDNRPTSHWQGIKEGAAVALFNMARLAETASDATSGRLEKLGNAISAPLDATLGRLGEAVGFFEKPPANAPRLSVNQAQARFNVAQAAKPNKGSNVGKFVGNIVGTLPTVALPGGPFAQGAYSTGLLTNARELDKIAAEMFVGGLLGKAGDKAIRAVAKVAAPQASKTLQTLTKRGVRLTPGQAARGSNGFLARALSSAEDRGASLPGPTGDLIRQGQSRASEDFVKGAVNDVLGEVGQSLPAGTKIGYDAVAEAQRAAGGAYDDALRSMSVAPDRALRNDVGSLVRDVKSGGLADPQLKQFRQTVKNVVLRRAKPNKGLSGDTFQTVISELNGKARKFSASSVASEQELGGAYSTLADYLEAAARRQSPPEAGAALDAANRAYAKLVRVEGAAKNAKGGVFSPAQLETSIRQSDGSVRKRAIAAGKGLMQNYASAGREILPQAIGDSGTAGRESVWNPFAWGVDLAAYLPYLAADKVAPSVLLRQPSPQAEAFSRLLELSAPTASKAIPITAYSLANER